MGRARVSGSVKAGDVVTIVAKSGKRWDARVTRVVWTDGSVSICATESLDRPALYQGSGWGLSRRERGAGPLYEGSGWGIDDDDDL